MRRLGAGLGSLALAAGWATTFALSAGASPPEGTTTQRAAVDELPNPAEEKRRALREVALQRGLAGDAKGLKRGALARWRGRSRATQRWAGGGRGRWSRSPTTSTSSSPARRRTRSS